MTHHSITTIQIMQGAIYLCIYWIVIYQEIILLRVSNDLIAAVKRARKERAKRRGGR